MKFISDLIMCTPHVLGLCFCIQYNNVVAWYVCRCTCICWKSSPYDSHFYILDSQSLYSSSLFNLSLLIVEGTFQGVELVVKLLSFLCLKECMPVTWLSLPSGVGRPTLTSPALIFLRAYLYVCLIWWCVV